MRLFFAAFPDAESRRRVAVEAQSLALSPPSAMHPPEKYHMTLLFLGNEKPLRPHITVARKIAQAPVLPSLSELRWTASAFSLVASATAPTGSVYTVVDTWPLLDIASRR